MPSSSSTNKYTSNVCKKIKWKQSYYEIRFNL